MLDFLQYLDPPILGALKVIMLWYIPGLLVTAWGIKIVDKL